MKSANIFSSNERIIIDVRSPMEFSKGHIPGAISLPLFSDDQRKVVGTSYKKEGREKAIAVGLGLIDIPSLISQLKLVTLYAPLLVYCARGGMRSQSMGRLFQCYGYPVEILEGGYKYFRGWVLEQFEKSYPMVILGGKTGTGKTKLLHELKQVNEAMIDLEALANHKGSVFGGEKEKQPTQQQFENNLAKELFLNSGHSRIWLEDESLFIGGLKIPKTIYQQIQDAFCVVINMGVERRIDQTLEDYLSLGEEFLLERIYRIKKRLGGERIIQIVKMLQEKNYHACCKMLFTYYDKKYLFSISTRDQNRVENFDMGKMAFSKAASMLAVQDFGEIQNKQGDPSLLNC